MDPNAVTGVAARSHRLHHQRVVGRRRVRDVDQRGARPSGTLTAIDTIAIGPARQLFIRPQQHGRTAHRILQMHLQTQRVRRHRELERA